MHWQQIATNSIYFVLPPLFLLSRQCIIASLWYVYVSVNNPPSIRPTPSSKYCMVSAGSKLLQSHDISTV